MHRRGRARSAGTSQNRQVSDRDTERTGEVRASPSPGATSTVGRLRPLCRRSSTPNLGPHEEGTGGRQRQRTSSTPRKPKYSEPRSQICCPLASRAAGPSPRPRKPSSGPTERSGPSRIAAPRPATTAGPRTSPSGPHRCRGRQLRTARSEGAPSPTHRPRSATSSPRHDDVGRWAQLRAHSGKFAPDSSTRLDRRDTA